MIVNMIIISIVSMTVIMIVNMIVSIILTTIVNTIVIMIVNMILIMIVNTIVIMIVICRSCHMQSTQKADPREENSLAAPVTCTFGGKTGIFDMPLR